MGEIKSYPVFEADQVLSADHLNDLLQYVEEETRLTRTQLIGIGIACGLDTAYNPTSASITITKGVGVTSLGYLVRFPEGTGKNDADASVTYTHYRTYALPEGAKVKQAAYASWTMLELLEATEAEATDSELKTLSDLNKYAVVLFLEYNELDLKNCTTDDCNDKGRKVELTVKPLLVLKTDLERFSPDNVEGGKETLPDLVLKRFNVPFNRLRTATEVLNAFHYITDNQAIKSIADAYNTAHDVFRPILGGASPFTGMQGALLARLNQIKSDQVIYSQYFYDHLDDLVKAYHELREVGQVILSECCPDEDLFPFHLMLGEADKNTADGISAYRQYFLHSPLFGTQQQEMKALQLLFERMEKLVDTFSLPNEDESLKFPVRITPSLLGREPLSWRAIPYYYKVEADLFSAWNFEKTRRKKERTNLSYKADTYATADHVLNPLKYDLEPYNFFRVEGHIGKEYKEAVYAVLKQRSTFNLPFDVVALNIRRGSADAGATTAHCYFQDLESLYNVLLSELLCKVHHPVCLLARLPYVQLSVFARTTASLFNAAETNTSAENFKVDTGLFAEAFRGGLSEFLNATGAGGRVITSRGTKAVLAGQQQSFIDIRRNRAYSKGIFLREFCQPKDKTVGAEYLRLMGVSQAPLQLPPVNLPSRNSNVALLIQVIYGHILYFTDTVEEMLKALLPYDLADLDVENFERKYSLFTKEARDLGNLLVMMASRLEELFGKNSVSRGYLDDMETAFMSFIINEMQLLTRLCMDEQIGRLKEEYLKRLAALQADRWFSLYSALHPGIEHKAGVPKGGTFILLYDEQTGIREGIRAEVADIDTELVARAERNTGAATFRTEAALRKKAIKQLLCSEEADEAATRVSSVRACIEDYVEKGKGTLRAEELLELEQALEVLNTKETEVDFFKIKERAVFADFYLPYLCCSNCAPVSYIIQETKPDPVRPTVSIEPDEFCNTDEGTYKIIASPAGGKVSGKGVSSSKLEFSPSGLKEGDYTITYKLEEETVTTTVKVFAPKSAEFEFDASEQADGNFLVALAAEEEDASAYEWYIDEGLAPVNTSAKFIHSVEPFAGETKTLVVKLRVSSGKCGADEETKEIPLRKKPREENQKLTVCYAPRFFIEQLPAGTTAEILDAGTLEITDDLIVHSLDLKVTKTFTVKYKLKNSAGDEVTKTVVLTVVKPVSSFIIEYRWRQENPNPVGELGDYIVTAESSTAFSYNWNFRDMGSGQIAGSSNNPAVFPRNNDINAGIEVTLTVIEVVNNIRCDERNTGTLSREDLDRLFEGRKLRVEDNKVTDA